VRLVPILLDCTDGFGEAYYGRSEGLLDLGARSACSVWSLWRTVHETSPNTSAATASRRNAAAGPIA
jgi:hypothetical protein